MKHFLLATLLAGSFCSCTTRRSTEPPSTEPRVFAGAIDYSQAGPARSVLFIYDYDSLEVLDSMTLPAPSVDAILDEDGRSLFVVTSNDLRTRSIWKFDLMSRQSLWHYDIARWVNTPDGMGRLRALNNHRWLHFNRTLISAESGELIKTFSDDSVPFGGPASSTCIALGTVIVPQSGGAPSVIQGYDVAGDSSWGLYDPHLLSGTPLDVVYTAELLPDLRRILVVGVVGVLANSWIVIGDLQTGETLLEQALVYPFGQILVSENGTHAVVSDPSRTLIYDSWPTLDLFDLAVNRHLDRISWDPLQSEAPSVLIYPGQLGWLPGSESFVIGSPGDFNSAGPMAIVDLDSFEITRFFSFPGENEHFAYFTGGMTSGSVISDQ